MKLVYNIDFELVGVMLLLILHIVLSVYYSSQSEVNRKFKSVIRYLLAAELMDIVTAVTISCADVIPPALNMAANTVYFALTFRLSYIFLRYVESCVYSPETKRKSVLVNKIIFFAQLALLFVNLFTKLLFDFNSEGEYVHGSLYLCVYAFTLYYICFSAAVLIKNHGLFEKKRKYSIGVYIFMCVLGPVIQMFFFPDVLLSLFTPTMAALVILFSMETPDYQLLMKTLAELEELRKNLQKEVKRQTQAAEERREKLERLSQQTILTLAKTIDAKDRYTNGHSERVAGYSKEIAARMGLSEQEQQDIYYMGLLHDIGKIGISDAIINKTEKLTDEEYRTIRRHPEIGENILKNIKEIPGIAVGAKFHHEKYDGSGYPTGAAGDEIPLPARIIGIADAYDAMASTRSYRDVLPQEVVRAEIAKGRGTQFDPACADILLEMIDEDKEYRMRQRHCDEF